MCRSPSEVETTSLVVANAITKWKSSDRPLAGARSLGDGVPVAMDGTQWVLYVLLRAATILG